MLLSALLAFSLAAEQNAVPEAPSEPMSVWFTQPGRSFHEACVLGNGRLGVMDFGGVEVDRLVLNESSMWSGGPYEADRPDAWKCLPAVREKLFAGDTAGAWNELGKGFRYADGVSGWGDDNQFGTYQILADLNLNFGGKISFSSPSGHEKGDGKSLDNCVDGDPGSKWCVNVKASDKIVWQRDTENPKTLTNYQLTSADDVPLRDPQQWLLEGSSDGKTWIELDRQELKTPFEKRGQTKSFAIAKPAACRFYRFTFTAKIDTFQVAEITLGEHQSTSPISAYRRDTNLRRGLATTSFVRNGVRFTREVLVSKPGEVIAIRLKADKPGALNFSASLNRRKNAARRVQDGHQILEGQLPFHKPGTPGDSGEGTRYQALLGARTQGGTMSPGEAGIEIKNADEVVLVVSAGTSLSDADYLVHSRQRLDAALKQDFDTLLSASAADHQSYMDRCQLSLPEGKNSRLPTPERVKLAEKESDPALAALYFQFGRHLLISGSRPDSYLPNNLQGIWAEEYSAPWHGDFHSNINLQMNYWPAETTGLGDCALPLMRFIKNLVPTGSKTAKAYYNAPGWIANHTQNPWFETAPSYLPACIGPTGGAWLTQHLWWHYDFSRDTEFLKQYYPVMRGASEFFLATLIEDPKTRELTLVPSNSPENSYAYIDKNGQKQHTALCIGSTYDKQIVRELFLNTARAARILGTDADFAAKIDAALARLSPTRVNAEGRIMEWNEDFEETEIHHRHCSHLWGLFPGSEIHSGTAELFNGAQLSLERRGDASTGWSMGWKANFWARLGDGDHAAKMLSMLIGRGAPNLFCLHPPFQIDGNFGGCSAVAEMLLQSQAGQLVLLPALPSTWQDGQVRGLHARGGFVLDITWKAGKITELKVTSQCGSPCQVRCGDKTLTLELKKGESRTLKGLE